MYLTLRQTEILDFLRAEGRVQVEDLAEQFNVTVQTIRRDLTELSDMGKLERVHGGAVFKSSVTNIGYHDRRQLNEDAKQAIARECAGEIPDGASIFMNIGTSTEAVARELLHHKNLMVVTNNMNVANILVENNDCEIIVAGGKLRRSDGGLIGHLTTSVIKQFKFDLAVIGCSALDSDGDVLDFDFQEVDVSQTILAHSKKAYLVSDHSKFQRRAPARICSLSQLDMFFTDKTLSGPLTEKCQEWNTSVRVCGV